MHDLVLRNAHLVDGTNTPGRDADIAIDSGRITAVGDVSGRGREEIDAAGRLVTPGWVDIHTHYDGQVTWDPDLTPSSWHGVTTLVMGNCGVGFAPVLPDRRDWLIGLMEGVEDIPGTALAEGIRWEWETFGEYLDALDRMPRAVDVGTQVPHGAVRAYVMGERGARNEAATPEEIEAMSAIVRDGLVAGALGFSTSRTMLHRAVDGEPVPGTFAGREELRGIGRGIAAAGHGVFEMASDLTPADQEFEWMSEVSRESKIPITYALLQNPLDPGGWRGLLERTDRAVAAGADIRAQIACRPTGLVLGWDGTFHPFSLHAAWREIASLPREERVARLRDPEVRRRLVEEEPEPRNENAFLVAVLTMGFDRMFRLDDGERLDYEPPATDSVAAVAERTGRAPRAILYDLLMERDGRGLVYLPLLNYAEFNFDHIREMFDHPRSVLSLSDGGAHCGVISDASFPTYLLTHWVRDRRRGAKIPLERAVSMQTRDTAALYGLGDRGVVAPGYRADLNVIDFDALDLLPPEMAFDLPAGGRRMIQKARGYEATIVAGEITYRQGERTNATPGRLLRGPR